MGVGSRARFQTSTNCSKLSLLPRRFDKCKCQSRGEMRPSCQSFQRTSFSRADQISSGESEIPSTRPLVARATLTGISTRPISKMMACTLGEATRYSFSAPGMEAARLELRAWSCRLARRMLMIAGMIERRITTALQVAAPEKERILAPVERRSRRAADPVTDLVAHGCAKHDRQKQKLKRNYAARRKNTCGDEQGIPRKKKADEESGFDKNNRADEWGTAGAD